MKWALVETLNLPVQIHFRFYRLWQNIVDTIHVHATLMRIQNECQHFIPSKFTSTTMSWIFAKFKLTFEYFTQFCSSSQSQDISVVYYMLLFIQWTLNDCFIINKFDVIQASLSIWFTQFDFIGFYIQLIWMACNSTPSALLLSSPSSISLGCKMNWKKEISIQYQYYVFNYTIYCCCSCYSKRKSLSYLRNPILIAQSSGDTVIDSKSSKL